MSSDWPLIPLSDVTLSINTGLDAIRRAPIVGHETDIKCLRIQDISQGKPISQWGFTETKSTDFEKYQLKKNDIIMARTCSTGINYLVKENLPAVFNNGLARIRLDLEKTYPPFMYYVFQSKEFASYINGISGGTSVQLNMKVGDVVKYELKLPPKEKQIKIAQILGNLDKKIALNHQTNQILEAIAQAIFKSWFVDFDPVKAKIAAKEAGASPAGIERAVMCAISGKSLDELDQLSVDTLQQLKATAALFPDALVESELGLVPEGWGVKTFGDVSQCFDSKRIPLSKKQREEKKPGNIPYYGATSIMDYVNEWVFDGIYLLLGEDGSVIKDDGTPFIQYIWGKSWVNNHAHVLRGKNGVSTEQLMLFIQGQNIKAYITGAVQLKLNQGNMNRIPFLDAGHALNSTFYELIKPLYEQIRNKIEETKSLIDVRDLLLPKLLSGDLKIHENKELANV